MLCPIEQFKSAMQEAGLTPPEHVVADGMLHRFSSNGRPGDDSGWYVCHDDANPAGAFGCWRTGSSHHWSSKPQEAMTVAEREDHRRHLQAVRLQREADLLARQQQAAQQALSRWQAASPASSTHPYLVAKGVQAHGLRLVVGVNYPDRSATTILAGGSGE